MAREKEGAAPMAWWRERRRRRWCKAGVVREDEGQVGCMGRKLNRPMGGWADWAEIWRKILFGIKIGFLNISMLWKFVQGDLGGILIWGFF
jgi:hypothetical protein